MGYIVRTRGVRWYLRLRTDHGQGGVEERTVSPSSDEFRRLGFAEAMTPDEARVALKRIHMTDELSKALQRGSRIQRRIRSDKAIEAAFLPKALVNEFEQHVVSGLTQKPEKWQLVKKLIASLDFPPETWNERKAHFYGLFTERGYSTYTVRLYVRLLNGWGTFYCKRMRTVYDDIPVPKGEFLRTIKRAHLDKTQGGLTTEPLTVELLELAKTHLDLGKWLWLAVSLWFGLRREEVEQLKQPQSGDNWYVATGDTRFRYVLMVYQWKLHREAVAPAKCWKAVPAVSPEQEKLIEDLLTKTLTTPRPKDIKTLNPRLTLRSGRKGFGQLMNGLGYAESTFDRWLGHVGHSTFSKHYSNKEIAHWEPPVTRKRAG